MDLRKNTVIGKMMVKTNKGSIRIKGAWADGDWVALSLDGNRVLIYSFSSVEEKGHVFGTAPEVSASSGLVAVSAGSSDVNVYELATTKLRAHYTFPSGVAIKGFSSDGKQLFVLTRDQTAYVVDPSVPLSVVAAN